MKWQAMKLLVVSKVPIFPLFGGYSSRIKTLCDEAKNLGLNVSFILLPAKDRGDYDLVQHSTYFGNDAFWDISRHIIFSMPFLISTLIRREINRIRYHLGRSRTLSENVDYRFDAYLNGPIRKIISNLRPDILVIECVHFSKILFLAPHDCLKIIDTLDSFAHEFIPLAERSGLSRADRIIAIQHIEAERFRNLVEGEVRVDTVSHIIPKMNVVDTQQCKGFSFVGSDFDANNVSLRWLYNEVLPLVVRVRPGCRLFVAGTVCGTIPDDDRVVKLGKIDDLHTIYSQAPILANAIRKGTGVKIKLLEALASGVPVVSTRLGVAGIDDRFLRGVNITNDSDAEGFASRIIELFDNAILRKNAGERAIYDMATWNIEQRKALAAVFSRK